MYGVVRHYRFDPQASETIDHHVRTGVMQPVRETPGFVAYYRWTRAREPVCPSASSRTKLERTRPPDAPLITSKRISSN